MNERTERNESGSIGKSISSSKVSPDALKTMRLARKETQSRFWGRFGVTQTRGSRFELGQEIPQPIGILIRLYLDGIVSDGDLWRARRRPRIASKQRALAAQGGENPMRST
jgi:hypothetical protein